MNAVCQGPTHAVCNAARNLTCFDLGYKHNPCFWEFCDDPELPCQAASSLYLSGRLSRDLPRGSPDLNNSTAGGKNDPAWVCHRSDTKAMPALQFGFRWLKLWRELHLWIATAHFVTGRKWIREQNLWRRSKLNNMSLLKHIYIKYCHQENNTAAK